MLYSDTLQCIIISYTNIILLLSQKCHKIPHFIQNRLMLAAPGQTTASHYSAITSQLLTNHLYSILLSGS